MATYVCSDHTSVKYTACAAEGTTCHRAIPDNSVWKNKELGGMQNKKRLEKTKNKIVRCRWGPEAGS
ncbi:hypothetical protein LEMLEM_LOCUS4316 [Lemmus lemmus]